ncbi:hypothetical protein KY284_007746 [Solanum tuberosum]|nr:hypothetical protein KY284_007746 [Solanum tuberosum]
MPNIIYTSGYESSYKVIIQGIDITTAAVAYIVAATATMQLLHSCCSNFINCSKKLAENEVEKELAKEIVVVTEEKVGGVDGDGGRRGDNCCGGGEGGGGSGGGR